MVDVIVVGGRCAGAPTAMLLARAGLRVRLIERSPELGDTISGQVIQVSGVERLRTWGLLDVVLATDCPPIFGARNWVDGQLLALPPSDGRAGPLMLAPRRGALDPVLLEAASQAGAIAQLGVSVRGLLTDGPRVTGVSTEHGDYPARLVIGADGRNSRVAKLVNAPKYIDMVSTTYSYIAFWKNCPALYGTVAI
jgi:2-polyprenyl-6-methoxyphenol hydroxylase-like FAD-dependent oxidoreductase